MPRAYVSSRGRAGVSVGLPGLLIAGFLYLLGLLILAAVIAAVFGVFLLTVLAAWTAVGVDRLLVASSSKYRARRVARGPIHPLDRITSPARVLTRHTKLRR